MKGVKNKVFLIAGIVMLIMGLILKIIEVPRYVFMLFFILGGGFKSVYLLNGFRSGTLAGRFFLGLLLFGLIMLFFSIVLRKKELYLMQANIMAITAILLKILSIVGMIKTAKIRKSLPSFNNSSDISALN